MKVYDQEGRLLLDTGLQTEQEGSEVVLVVDLGSRELQGEILDVLKDVKLCLSKMSDLEFKED